MIKTRQYALTFRGNDSYQPDDYCVTDTNSLAWQIVNTPEQWSSHCAFLTAPAYGGKTHLAHIFAHNTKGDLLAGAELKEFPNIIEGTHICVDDVDQIEDPELLFHLFNKTKEEQTRLFLTSSVLVSDFPHQLPDLTSRLKSAHLLTILEPDERLIRGIFMKRFADLQWRVKPDVLDYLLLRIPRTYEAIAQIIEHLIPAVEENHRNITLPVLRSVLEEINASEDA